jgi:hypothetical protein
MINNEIFQNFTLGAAATVPIIIAVVQAIKMSGFVKDKYAPFVSIIVGIIISILLVHDFMNDISGTVLTGILFGLSASGLYSGLSTTANAIKMERLEKEERREKAKHNNPK